MFDAQLTKGSNAPLPAGLRGVKVVVQWDGPDVELDASALLLDGSGRVSSDDDMVFYNQPVSADGSVRYLGPGRTEEHGLASVVVDLEAVTAEVATIALAASTGGGTFGDVRGLAFSVFDPEGALLVRHRVTDAGDETAMVLGEVYRRAGAWKVRAVSQGWASGLAGLATDLGVTVADADDEEPQDPPTAGPLTAPGEPSEDDAQAGSAPPDAAPEPAEPGAAQPSSTAAAPGPAQAPGAGGGVRTRKRPPVKVVPPALKLAGGESWTAARLFSVSGVGTAAEQEKRATSALLAVMMAVRPFGRGVCARLGAPSGLLETYLEVQFARGEGVVIPDGVLRVQRGGRTWTALLETKTGDGQLRREQVESYLDVARQEGYDAVVTLSNDIPPGPGEHPVQVDRRKLARVGLFHLSWAEVLHEAQMVLAHRGAPDALQAWLLHELIRYLQHPRSGATGLEDMGPSWVPVREAVSAGTLRAADRKVPDVVDGWNRLVRQLCLRLTAELGVEVTQQLPRRLASDPSARTAAGVDSLVATGRLDAVLRVPGAIGPLQVLADLRVGQVTVSTRVPAPQEGTAARRTGWLLKQLVDAPPDVLVEAACEGSAVTTCERLELVRADPSCLGRADRVPPSSFLLARSATLGTKRSGVRGAFIPSVVTAVEGFYGEVVQSLRPWVPRAPRLPDEPEAAADDLPSPLVSEV